MPRQPVIAFLAGSLIVFTAGLIGLFGVQNTDSKYMIIAGSVGCFILMFYVMWASGRAATREAELRATRIRYPQEAPVQGVEAHEMPANHFLGDEPEIRPAENSLETHGAIVRTSGEGGRLTYIEFADGYSIGTPPKGDEEKKDRDRYEAVKV